MKATSSPSIARMTWNASSCPKVLPDVQFWTLFRGKVAGEDQAILGSRTVNRYLTVPNGSREIVQETLLLLDGKHSVSEIQDLLRLRFRREVPVAELCGKLGRQGLLQDSVVEEEQGFGFERLSLRLFTVQLDRYAWMDMRRIAWIVPWIAALALMLMVAAAGLSVAHHGFHMAEWSHAFVGRATIGRGHVYALGLIAVSILLHELSHGLAASYFGLQLTSMSTSLYLGVIPMAYVKIRGVYTLEQWKRIAVWGAGFYCNVALAASCVVLVRVTHLPLDWALALKAAALSNLTIGFANLFPFLPTDGYYIACTLLRTVNIRTRAWKQFALLLSNRSHGLTPLTATYLLATLAFIVFALTKLVLHLHSAGHGASRAMVLMWAQLVLGLGGLVYGIAREVSAVKKADSDGDGGMGS